MYTKIWKTPGKDIQFDENTEILRLEQAGPIKKSSEKFSTSYQKLF